MGECEKGDHLVLSSTYQMGECEKGDHLVLSSTYQMGECQKCSKCCKVKKKKELFCINHMIFLFITILSYLPQPCLNPVSNPSV